MAIVGHPFDGIAYGSADWREQEDAFNYNQSNLTFTSTSNTELGVGVGSRFKSRGHHILFESTETVTLPSSVASKTTFYLYVTSDAVSKTYSELKFSTSLPTLNNYEGLQDIVIASYTVEPGTINVQTSFVRPYQPVNLVQNSGYNFGISNISVLDPNLQAGRYYGTGLLDTPPNVANVYVYLDIQIMSPGNYQMRRLTTFDGKVEAINTTLNGGNTWSGWEYLNTPDIGKTVNLNDSGTTADFSEFFFGIHPYDFGYRHGYARNSEGNRYHFNISSNTQTRFSILFTGSSAGSSGYLGTLQYDVDLNINTSTLTVTSKTGENHIVEGIHALRVRYGLTYLGFYK